MLLARILATVRQAQDREGATALFLQFCHRTVNEEEEIAHKLLGAEFQNQLETLRTLMEKSLWAPEVQHVSTNQPSTITSIKCCKIFIPHPGSGKRSV